MDIEKKLYKLSQKAYKKGEVPVAALIVKNNKIISKAYNKKNSSSNPLYHAEVLAILKAAKKIEDWRLSDCVMYVTLKPCNMCSEIIKEARLSNVFYFLDNDKIINSKTNFSKLESSYSNYYRDLLTLFFKSKR